MKRFVIVLFLTGVLAGGALRAEDDLKDKTKTAAQKTGEGIKEGAEATGHAAKKAGRKVKRGTKKAVHAGAEKTGEGAKKVEEKTRP